MKSKTKVLIVDDDKASRDLVGDIVESLGYTMLKCESYHDAKEAFKKHGPFHLVITDLYMPNESGKIRMLGYDLARFVNKESDDNCPTIVLSSELNPLVHCGLFFSGGSLFITKPMKRDVLSVKIQKYAQLGRWCQARDENNSVRLFSGEKKHV